MRFPESNNRIRKLEGGQGGGAWIVDGNIFVIASDGGGWDHVSVSLKNRCPKWDEMCFIKSLFWDDEETVIQFHPKKSNYRNTHPYCLHMWRKQGSEIELPPTYMIG